MCETSTTLLTNRFQIQKNVFCGGKRKLNSEKFDNSMAKIHVGQKFGWLIVTSKEKTINRRHLVELQCRCGRKKYLQLSQILLGKYYTCGNKECSAAYRQAHPRKGREPEIIGGYAPGSLAKLSSKPRFNERTGEKI